jgi:membrane protease YdiL (CAAX protease family)
MNEFLELAARGRTTWWRYVAAIALCALLIVVIFAVAIVALEISGVGPTAIKDAVSNPSHFQFFLGANGAAFAALLVSLALAIRWLHAKRFTDIIGDWSWRKVLIGAGAWLAVCVVTGLIPGVDSVRFTGSWATATLALWAIPTLAVQTFTEEFVFRGYITQGLLLATRRPLITALLSGLIFGAGHIPNGWPQAAGVTLFGIMTAIIAMRTGGIAVTFGMHLANNLFASVVMVSTNDVFRGIPALFTVTTPPNLIWFESLVFPLATLTAVLWHSRALFRSGRLVAIGSTHTADLFD